eukprot:5522096-Pyramimonas_sp.AAC.1
MRHIDMACRDALKNVEGGAFPEPRARPQPLHDGARGAERGPVSPSLPDTSSCHTLLKFEP